MGADPLLSQRRCIMETKRVGLLLSAALVAGIALGAIGYRLLSGKASPVEARRVGPVTAVTEGFRMTEILRTDLAGMEGKEAILVLFEAAPGAMLPKHYHPGEVMGYGLEGSLTITVDGEPGVTLRPGDSYHAPHRAVHFAKAGPQGARGVVFNVHDKGEPLRVPAE
jgi:quercetin dioxygenase-like cupin family protein